MKIEHEALIELREMEKTLDNTRKYVSKHISKIAFHWYSVYGFPAEMFEEMMKEKDMTLSDQLNFIIKFYESK